MSQFVKITVRWKGELLPLEARVPSDQLLSWERLVDSAKSAGLDIEVSHRSEQSMYSADNSPPEEKQR